MKKLTLILLSCLFISNFAMAEPKPYTCNTKYSTVESAILAFYKQLAGEILSAEEEEKLQRANQTIAASPALQSEMDRLNFLVQSMVDSEIAYTDGDLVALIAGAHYRTCSN